MAKILIVFLMFNMEDIWTIIILIYKNLKRNYNYLINFSLNASQTLTF